MPSCSEHTRAQRAVSFLCGQSSPPHVFSKLVHLYRLLTPFVEFFRCLFSRAEHALIHHLVARAVYTLDAVLMRCRAIVGPGAVNLRKEDGGQVAAATRPGADGGGTVAGLCARLHKLAVSSFFVGCATFDAVLRGMV